MRPTGNAICAIARCAVIAEHLRQEATQGYARARGLEARARALDDASQVAPVDAADPIDTTQPEPAALAHAPSPDAAPVDGEPEPDALAEKMINVAGQWITVNSKTTKKIVKKNIPKRAGRFFPTN